MTRRFLALAACVALLLTACSGGGSKATDPPASTPPSSPAPSTSVPVTSTAPPTSPPSSSAPATPAVPADVPRTGPNTLPGEKPPVMPAAATQHTAEGAAAFATFFMKTIDWGFATTSGAYIRHYYQPSCVECASHADNIDATRKAGDHYIGGRFTDITAPAGAGSIGGPSGAELSSIVTFNIQSLETVDGHGNFVNGGPAYHGEKREVWLAWRSGGWMVVYMAPAK